MLVVVHGNLLLNYQLILAGLLRVFPHLGLG